MSGARKRKPADSVVWFGVAENGLKQPLAISAFGLSRNGRFVVTSDDQLVFRVFDLEASRCIAEVKVPSKFKGRFDNLVKVSVSDDGRFVAGRIDDCSVVGDVTDWKPQRAGQSEIPLMLPDGKHWVALHGWVRWFEGDKELGHHWEKNCHGWDLDVFADGRVVAVFDQSHVPRGVLHVFSPAMKSLASIEIPENLHKATVGFIDKDHVVAVTPEGRVHFWDVARNKLESKALAKATREPKLLAPLRAVIVDGDDITDPLRILHLDTGKLICETSTWAWATSSDGSVLVSGEGATISRRDPATFAELQGAPLLRTNVGGIGFEPSGDYLWSADREHAHRWSVADRSVKATIDMPDKVFVAGITGEATGVLLSAFGESLTYKALPSGKQKGIVEGGPRFPCVSPDGELVGTVNDGIFRVATWDGKVKAEWARTDRVSAMALSPDKKHVYLSFVGSYIQVRTVAAKPAVVREFNIPKYAFHMVVSGDGKHLAMVSDSPLVHVFALSTGKLLHELRLPKRTTTPVALSPDSRWVAASDQVSTLVWNMRTGERHLALKTGANSLAFSPSSQHLAIGGDGVVGIVTL